MSVYSLFWGGGHGWGIPAGSRGDKRHGIREDTYNGILTWAPDRISRNAGDLGRIVDLMDSGKLKEMRTFGQKFGNNPNEKFFLMILGSQAKLENDNRGINVVRGLCTRAEMGLWSGIAPLGYLTRTDG